MSYINITISDDDVLSELSSEAMITELESRGEIIPQAQPGKNVIMDGYRTDLLAVFNKLIEFDNINHLELCKELEERFNL